MANSFIDNLAAGKTATGGAAKAGDIAWARAQLAAAAQNASKQPTPKTTAPAPGTPGSAQSWINNSNSGQGGLDAYTAKQNERYGQALQSGDTDLINRLNADSQRVGYQLNNPMGGANSQNNQSSQSYIDALAAARRNQTLAELEKSRNASLSNMAAEKSAIQPKYYDARNQAAAGSQQQARNFSEFMAARGGANSGSNAQAELTSGMALQGNLGSLGRQETQAYGDIERRTSDLQNAYQSDVASATAGMEADRMQAMLSDYYQQQQRELQIAELTGKLGNQQTLGGKSLNQNILDSNRNYELNSNNQQFNQGMATKQLERSNFESDRQYNFAVGQQSWENNFKTGQFDWQKAQQSWENAFQDKNFEQSMKDAAASRGLQWASLNQRDKESVADNAFRNKQFEYQKGQDTIANDLAKQKANAGEPYSYKSDPAFMSDAAKMVKEPERSRKELREKSQSYIDKYGIEGYNYLISTVNK